MNALLICPHTRPEVEVLTEREPLVNLRACGKRIIEYWLEHLAALGTKTVLVLASDRPEQVRAAVGDGRQWGLRVEVFPESEELSIEEARAKYQRDGGLLPAPDDIIVLDRLPISNLPLWESYGSWFAAVQYLSAHDCSSTRIGLHEIQSGVFGNLRTRVHPTAKLIAPCWLGQDVYVGAGAVVGPRAVIEDRCVVRSGAESADSIVAPDTFVGGLTEIKSSLAFGNTLVNWQTGSSVNVPDPFLLRPLALPTLISPPIALLGRLMAAIAATLTAPLAFYVLCKCAFRGQPALRVMTGVRPGTLSLSSGPQTFHYYEFTNVNRWVRRWPQLWSIVRGDFCWVGNRPISLSKAARLNNDFERLWLDAPVGFFSLGDVWGWMDSFSEEARAHASFYAAQRSWKLDL